MRRAFIVSTSAVAVGAMVGVAALVAQRHGSAPHLASTPITTAVPVVTAAAPTPLTAPPPPWPGGVTNPPPLTHQSDPGSGWTVTCDQQVGPWHVDTNPGAPTTPTELFHVSTVVVIATAVEEHGYWQRDDGRLPAENLEGLDYAPVTAVNFAVEKVIKGSAGPWLQLVEAGANPNNIAVCAKRATMGGKLPVAGQRYVLFLQRDDHRLLDRDVYGPLDRFPVVQNGIVVSDVQMRGYQPVPLDQFVTELQG